jgi:hypothetical protein
MKNNMPCLLGVIHLPPLPGSPRWNGQAGFAEELAFRETQLLAACGFDGVIVENFGDAPFFPGAVEPITIAAMTMCLRAAREAATNFFRGVNVLRNDADAALAIAVATHADASNARGRAGQTFLRRRCQAFRALGRQADRGRGARHGRSWARRCPFGHRDRNGSPCLC